jgi:RimJ/RimL family protein N-acetyltransferase
MIQAIKLISDPEEIKRLYEFIQKFPYDYPNYMAWVDKCYRELQLGYKKAFICINDGEIIANLIFQKHKQDPKSLELKNGRVDERYRRRKIFTSLYRAVEHYAHENGFLRIIADTHIDNQSVITTLENQGFVIEAKENLYHKDKLEVILSKKIK